MEEGQGDLCVFCIELHISSETLNSDPACATFFTFANPVFYCW